jgi:hypothetical protein
LIWHRDKNDRVITVLKCGKGWQFQFDNDLPFELKPDMEIEIAKEEFHRVIKGKGNLKVQIKEVENGSTN